MSMVRASETASSYEKTTFLSFYSCGRNFFVGFLFVWAKCCIFSRRCGGFFVLSKVMIYKGFLVYFERICVFFALAWRWACMPGLEVVLLGSVDDIR